MHNNEAHSEKQMRTHNKRIQYMKTRNDNITPLQKDPKTVGTKICLPTCREDRCIRNSTLDFSAEKTMQSVECRVTNENKLIRTEAVRQHNKETQKRQTIAKINSLKFKRPNKPIRAIDKRTLRKQRGNSH